MAEKLHFKLATPLPTVQLDSIDALRTTGRLNGHTLTHTYAKHALVTNGKPYVVLECTTCKAMTYVHCDGTYEAPIGYPGITDVGCLVYYR